MSAKREEILRRTKKLIVPGIIAGVIVILALWILYFLSDQQSQILGLGKLPWLALAGVATVFGPPLLFFAVRGRLYLLAHGTEIDGKVEKFALLPVTGTRPVTYAYTISGKRYSFKRDTPSTFISKMQVGSRVRLLVDPKKPQKAIVLDHSPDA